MTFYYVYNRKDINSKEFIIILIIPAIKREKSQIKYPCNNHNILVDNIKISEKNDKSFTFFVVVVFIN